MKVKNLDKIGDFGRTKMTFGQHIIFRP